MKESLSAAQEEEAQKLAQAISHAAHEDILAIARTLVATDNASLFGATEFKVRDIVLGVAAKAYQQHLQQKKLGWQTQLECQLLQLLQIRLYQ